MSSEKKLGLVFLGILVVAFCGVLTMRLSGNVATDDPVEVNVGGTSVAEAPAATSSGSAVETKPASGSPPDRAPASLLAMNRPDAARTPGTDATSGRTPVAPPAYLPPPSAMRPAAGSASPPPFSGTAMTSPPPSNDPFSRGPAATANPPAMAMSPNPYGGAATPAPTDATSMQNGFGASAPSGAGSPPPFVPTTATAAPAAPAIMPPATGGNPLRGAASPEVRSPGVAALAGPAETAGFPAAAASSASREPTLPTGRETAGGLTGRTEMAATFSPPATTTAPSRFGAPGGVASTNDSPSQPGMTPAAAPREIAVTSAALPAAHQDKPYVVASDDSFWSISEKAYGNGAYYRALFQYNRDRYPNSEDVRPGSVLDIPPLDVLKRQFPELTTGDQGSAPAENAAAPVGPSTQGTGATTYVVREGDTLFEIARRELGKPTRWNEIYELNRSVLGERLEHLRPGVELRLR